MLGPEGKFQINLPWKENKEEMVEECEKSHTLAKKRLDNLEKKLSKDKELGNAYRKVIQNYIEKSMSERLQLRRNSLNNSGFYLKIVRCKIR